ncbi:hypothetical protein [Clostridium sp. UBA6640]|jgi:hypothetical protein|uniref:hypothetical protein n=1 Tax=Clostridium sp. UBA6640 TaxID=1946370 RepID=UPI0025BCD872|nr:hypothetical protein [Clostridium sp. UBA6640]
MAKGKKDLYDPTYTYKKSDVDIQNFKDSYPVIERTNNGLLFPEGIKPDMDTEQMRNRD